MSVTEDYCSFELSKLLKEKGFDLHDTKELYVAYKDGYCVINNPRTKHYPTDEFPKATHQMALKWLREIYGLNVQVCIVQTIELKKAYNATIYSNACEQLKAYFGRNIFDGFKSYEEAVEAAIKYCLTNLI